MKKTISLCSALLAASCSTTKEPQTVGNVTGPDAKLIAKDWETMAARMGSDGDTLFDLIEGRQFYSSTSGRSPQGPYSCDDSGTTCWLGMTEIVAPGEFVWRWPAGRKRGLVRHETMHGLLSIMVDTGEIRPFLEGHPRRVIDAQTGERIDVARVVDWRWPDALTPISDPWLDLAEDCEVME